MYQSLSFGHAKVQETDFEKRLQLAKKHGFEAIESSAAEVMGMGVENFKALIDKYGLKVSSTSLPFHPAEVDEAAFEEAMKVFPEQVAAMAAVGCTRWIIWIFPSSDKFTKEENYNLHIERMGAVAKVLKEYGARLGLEFVGPHPMRTNKKYTFIYTCEDMLELAAKCGDNVGVLFDIYHWYLSGNNKDVFEHIGDQEKIILVHVNDAAEGPIEEQPDSPRCLPGETGVIDAKFAMDALRKMGYDGPIVTEPFSPKLPEMADDDERVACIKACMDKIGA